MNRFLHHILIVVCITLSACNGGKTIYEGIPPSITPSFYTYQVKLGDETTIAPIIEDDDGAIYTWLYDNIVIGSQRQLLYKGETVGLHKISFYVSNEYGEDAVDIKVIVYDSDTYRPFSSTSSSSVNEILTYLPAPGQFINDSIAAGFGHITTMEQANEYVEQRFSESKWISLGGFGGYVIGKYDHSVFNDGEYNIAIIGNCISTMSEPGTVWVMSDDNRNGEPDDTWYQLKGSEHMATSTIQDYSVTYYRPTDKNSDIEWTDNYEGSGTINYLTDYHDTGSYYPLWVEDDSYTLSGVRLETRNQQDATGMWICQPFEWGYADNYSNIDGKTSSLGFTNHFKISDAVDADGEAVDLQSIDFVKVQTGINGKSGNLGELSTEIAGIIDYNLIK